jgi:hypothetical protein
MSLNEHHELAPSSAARNVQCPGSTRAEQQFPERPGDDEEARAGTAAHWAFDQMLAGVILKVGDVAQNGVALDAEMLDAALILVDDVWAVCKQYGVDPAHVQSERKVKIHWWFGTMDVRIFALPAGGMIHLFVWDFKFGHRYVSEFENWQLLDYVFGSVSELSPEIAWERIVVHMRIVQPRCYVRGGAVREWVAPLDDLRAQFNIRKSAAEEAIGPNPRFRVGEECRDCRVALNAACPTLHKNAHAIMDHVSHEQPMGLPASVIGWELKYGRRAQAILNAYVSGLDAQAEHMIKSGQQVPGVGLSQGEGRTKWVIPHAQAIAMAAMMGVDIAQPPEAITPLQAKKKGLDPKFVDGLAKPGPGKVSITIDDGSLARRIGFGK